MGNRLIQSVKSIMGWTSAPFDLTNQKMVARMTGDFTTAGISVNEGNAMGVSAYFSCVRVLVETMGATPWAVYERDEYGNAIKARDHPLNAVLVDSPNAYQTSQDMRESQMMNLVNRGNSPSVISRNRRGEIIALTPVPWVNTQVEWNASGTDLIYHITRNGKRTTYPSSDIWHVRGFGGNELAGLSPLSYARETLGLSIATNAYAGGFFKRGGQPSGIIKMKEWLTPDKRKEAEVKVREIWEGMDNAHRIQLAEGGMEYQPVSVNPEDAQLLSTRNMQTKEICRYLRVPPHLIMDLEGHKYATTEQAAQDFVTYTLLPYAKRFEESAKKKLFAPAERSRYFLNFNFDGLLRADSLGRAQIHGLYLDRGVISRNEVRAMENKPRSTEDGMDSYTVQSQMVPISQLQKVTDAKTAA